MTRPILTLPLKAKSLPQQNADFTAEGAPPPGKVGMSNPDTGQGSAKPVLPASVTIPGTHTHRPADKNR